MKWIIIGIMNPPPPIELLDQRFYLIISQATLEHLIDPYKHLKDLVDLLDDDGRLVVHSVLPGFLYHRYPIDCFRFYPDWFEEVSKRLKLDVEDRQISVFNLTYKLRKVV